MMLLSRIVTDVVVAAPFSEQRRQESDEMYRRAVMRRLERRKRSKVDSPLKRRQLLMRSFRTHDVLMVRRSFPRVEPSFLCLFLFCVSSSSSSSSHTHKRTLPSISLLFPQQSTTTNEKQKTVKEDDLIPCRPCSDDKHDTDDGIDVDTTTGHDRSSNDGASSDGTANTGPSSLEETYYCEDDQDGEFGGTGQLRLGNGSLVPNGCAICLTCYERDDTVVWSSNPACSHAFHRDCLVGWFVRQQPETSCPCCRQEFTDVESIRRRARIRWDATKAFNIDAVRL
jgi:hypothetical protein